MPEENAATPITDADRLLAEGAPITLRDGRVVHLRYGFRGLLELERRLGSTREIDAAILEILNAEGLAYTKLSHFICAGLTHVEGFASDDELLELLDSKRLFAYGKAVGDALAEAFPEAETNGDRGKARRNNGRGDAGITRRQSSSAAPRKRSGA